MTEHVDAPASGAVSWIWLLVGFVLALIVGWGLFPTLLYSKKTQPFPFNHVVHTEEVGLMCEDCHRFREDGTFTGIPPLAECLECHTWSDRQNEDNAAETAFLEEFVTEDDELKKSPPWLSYARQPDCVYFSHIAHVRMGEIECEECHGEDGQRSEPRPYYQNLISTYSRDVWKKMKMTDCADCHLKYDKPENNACFVCHK